MSWIRPPFPTLGLLAPRPLLLLLLVGMAGPGHGDWTLDSEASSVSALSVKQYNRAESHPFKGVEGHLYPSGKARLNIQLASIEMGVVNQNETVVEELFEVGRFPRAQIRVQGDMNVLQALAPGESLATGLEGQLSLHGHEEALQADVVVMRLRRGGFRILSRRPVILDVRDFGMGSSLRLMATMARLDHISYAVGVSFDLVFRPL